MLPYLSVSVESLEILSVWMISLFDIKVVRVMHYFQKTVEKSKNCAYN